MYMVSNVIHAPTRFFGKSVFTTVVTTRLVSLPIDYGAEGYTNL
jgi:hypothetical protein